MNPGLQPFTSISAGLRPDKKEKSNLPRGGNRYGAFESWKQGEEEIMPQG